MTFRGAGYVSHPNTGDPSGWHAFQCGYCGNAVSGLVVSVASLTSGATVLWIQCTVCGQGSVVTAQGVVVPAQSAGPAVGGLPGDVGEAYEEARRCMSVGGYVATELVCRKILMHVAVEKGADQGKTFAEYIDHLEAQGYVTPPMKKWVGLIRTRGNDATHELTPVSADRAESTLMFTAELLRLTYEMESMADKYAPAPEEQ